MKYTNLHVTGISGIRKGLGKPGVTVYRGPVNRGFTVLIYIGIVLLKRVTMSIHVYSSSHVSVTEQSTFDQIPWGSG